MTILSVLMACGDESEQAASDATSLQASSTTVTAPVGDDCSDDQIRAAIAYGERLAALADRADTATIDIQAVLASYISRAATADRAEFPTGLRASADQFTAIDRDLAALGPAPNSYVDAVAIFSKALDSFARGLDTMAQGAEEDSDAKAQEGLALVSAASNLGPQMVAAIGDSDC